MDGAVAQAEEPELMTPNLAETVRPYSKGQVIVGLLVTLIGLVVFLLGAQPAMFGLDRSPVIGFVQIAVFLIGLGIVCVGGYISLTALWKNSLPSIAAEFGPRFVATGYVVAVFSGMADVFGIGGHALPAVPYFGTSQAAGVMVGEACIAFGFLLIIPYSRKAKPV
jgi:hypothetical protein